MKKSLAILIGFFLLLGPLSSLFAYETSNRAFINGPGIHLSTVKITSTTGSKWVISGFAPGIGSFNQNISDNDHVSFSYSNGTASINTTVTSSLGVPLAIAVTWSTPASPVTQTVNIPNPSRILTINTKRTNVSGTIGTFNLIGVTGVSGGVDQRTVNP
jgi:hypothetical protein